MHFPRNNFNEEQEKVQESSSALPTNSSLPQTSNRGSKHDVYYEGSKKNELNELKAYFKNTLSNPSLAIYRK